MNANVDQRCPSCGTDIHCDADIREASGVGVIERITATWECPECGVGFEHEHPFDTDLMERTGFHSWVGHIETEKACIVVEDSSGPNVVEEQENSVGEL